MVCVGYLQKKGFGHMLEVAQSTLKRDANLISSAQYNVGRAYFMVSILPVSHVMVSVSQRACHC